MSEPAIAQPGEQLGELRHRNARLEQQVRTLTERLVQIKGELARALARVGELATTDDTTGLLTSRAFAERANAEIARATRYQRDIGLVLLAENAARGLAEICRSEHRDCDLAGQTELGEIVLLLPETSLHGALVIGQRIRAQAARVTGAAPTIGCVSWPQHGRTLSLLLSAARNARSAR